MPMHGVNYDLRKPGRAYGPLIEAIKSLGAWAHVAESSWIVSTDLTDAEIRDALLPHIDVNDVLIVTALTGSWASYGLNEELVGWLNEATV